ncbi:DNA polymerase III subunit delta' [Streptococcus thoraltensis]|uniref:DNA polymerase III subunit delta' n=1 Tax=Streptococcus thoraltensis TaxID=55085 RepID=UPI001F593057|nr:DNA polymerase III subunit delta' [Streptococcus thoraltensis]
MSKNPLTTILEQQQPQLLNEMRRILERNKRSHAYLFTGGFASWEMAIWMTQYQFCEDFNGHEPCGQCRSCRLVLDDDFADLAILEPTNGLIKTDDVRSLLSRFSSSSYEGKEQVVIIRGADKMHVNAANSLLKVMEEPQSQVYLILLVEDDNQLLATIKSRCQQFHFRKNKQVIMTDLEQMGLLRNQAALLSDVASSVGEARRLAEDTKVLQYLNLLERFVNLLVTDKGKAYLEISRLASQLTDKDAQALAFQLLVSLLGQDLKNQKGLEYLDRLILARRMWQSNVSFQNALEYMILQA